MNDDRYSFSFARAACAVAAAALLAGCAYRLGSTLPPDLKTVAVPVFINHTAEPGLEMDTTSATIAEFQRDGSLRIAERDAADTVLEAKLVKYKLEPVQYRRDEAVTAQEYRLTLTADIVFRRRATGEVLTERKGLFGETLFRPGSDPTSARRQALPDAARDLGHQIVKNVVEFW